MNKQQAISEVRNSYTDDDNFTHIDVYKTDNEDEEGRTVAIVCQDTGKVYFLDNIFRGNTSVEEAIKEVMPQPKGETLLPDILEGELFVDAGDFDRTKEGSEIFIRTNIDGEQHDICNFVCDETGGPKEYATALATRYNGYKRLAKENTELKEMLAVLVEVAIETTFMGQTNWTR